MATGATRRPVMTLFSQPNCPLSHRVRLVLAEKGINADIVDVDVNNPPEDLIELNSYNNEPTLVDRDLVLYNSRVIVEYLDERFPHPPLMPVDPVARARARMLLYRIDNDWYSLLKHIEGDDHKLAKQARKELHDSLVIIAPAFSRSPFFMGEEFALIECSMAPILWRLSSYGIELPSQAKAVKDYAKRLFDRSAFKISMTDRERDLAAVAA